MPNRRWVTFALAAAAALPVAAHTPYGQWVVYRQRHLLIGAHREDARTYEFAKAVVSALNVELPDARARVARGPRPERIASLMITGQLLVSVLSIDEAARMAAALPPFDGYEPISLSTLAALDDDYILFATPDLPAEHAWLLLEALDHASMSKRPTAIPTSFHPGAAAFWEGAGKPE